MFFLGRGGVDAGRESDFVGDSGEVVVGRMWLVEGEVLRYFGSWGFRG